MYPMDRRYMRINAISSFEKVGALLSIRTGMASSAVCVIIEFNYDVQDQIRDVNEKETMKPPV